MLRFLHDGFMASGLDDPPLMEGQGAEAAAAVAAPVADEAVFDFLDVGNTAQRLVGGMVGAHIEMCIRDRYKPARPACRILPLLFPRAPGSGRRTPPAQTSRFF